jgi:hypothetical protein
MRVALHVSRSEFPDMLGAMREWLDSHKCPELRFETATDEGAILIRIDLPSVAMAVDFLQAFDPVSAAA